jgi:hypothetical protein
VKEEPGTYHVVPVDDIKEHEPSLECWCRPYRDPWNPFGIIHNALDRRELYENSVH